MKTEWDYTHLYQEKDEWQKDYEFVEKNIELLSEKLEKKPSISHDFLSILVDKFKIEETIERLYCYGKRHVDQDSTNEEMQTLYQRAWNLYSRFMKLQSKLECFIFEHEEEIKNWMSIPEIEHYKVYLDSIFWKKEHFVKEEDRQAIAILNKQQLLISQMYRSLVEKDIKYGEFENHKGKKVVCDNRELNKYLKSDDVKERKDAFLANMAGYKQLENSMATLLDMKLEKELTVAKLNHYDSVLDMKLHHNLLPLDTVTKLVEQVNQHIDLFTQYNDLRKTLLGLEEYHNYDLGLSISDISSKHYELEEAIEIIKKALKILGEEVLNYIDRALEEGWIDFFEKPNKRKDAFTCISYVGVPYVSVNFYKNLQGLRTVGHELGHMVHTALSKDHQPFEYFEYDLFLAEIASKVNELLIDEYLIDHAKTKEEKVFLLDSSIKAIANSLYYQTMMSEFEMEMMKQKKEKKMVSSQFLNNTYRVLYQKYYGNSITYDKELLNSWEKIPHYYIQDSFYLWQYATGICIAGKIVYQLKTNPNFKENYIKFLSLGKSVSIVEALKVVNIDLSDGSYIDDTIKVLEEQILKLKRLVR